MKAASLALACALLGATALAPASFAQTTGPAQTPAEASPATSSPDMTTRTGTQAQREWRDQEGRTGGMRRNRDDDDERSSSRDMRGGQYADDEDDDDDGDMSDSHHGGMQGMRQGMAQGMGQQGMGQQGMGQGMGRRLNPEMMRMHMRMMGAHARGAHLSLKRGDSQIDISCPGNENIAACVEAVGKLMDRLQTMPQTPR